MLQELLERPARAVRLEEDWQLEIFRTLISGMVDLLNYLYQITDKIGFPSYGLAIIFLTILIKMILYPLTKKQMISMAVMKKLQPKVKEIQDKWKERDQKKMSEMIMALYKENNANPLSGCLPLLIQMPILIALYRALFNFEYINADHAGFFWITSLSVRDPYYLMPLLAAATTFLQSKMTISDSDQTQRMMLYMMPLLIGWISMSIPSGMALYWVMFNIVGITQQYYINKRYINNTTTNPLREDAAGK